MNDERWHEVVDLLEVRFKDVTLSKKPMTFTDDLGHSFEGVVETVTFTGPQGAMKLERTTKPKILEKRAHYGKGSTGTARLEYVVSDSEQTHVLEAYRQDERGEWMPMSFDGVQ